MNEVKLFENEDLGIFVRTVLNDDGSISVNAEDAAIGYGWTQTQTKNGKEYVSVRWERMNRFSAECGFPHEWGKDDYIPESLFYRLGMKAGNAKAERFQNWLALKVIPAIRKTGSYSITQKQDSYMISDPVARAERWIEEQKQHKAEIAELSKEVSRLKPKAEMHDRILDAGLLTNFRDAAKEIGISQTQFTGWLKDNGYVYSNSAGELRPMEPYMESGLFQMKPYQNPYSGYSGTRTYLTGRGLAAFKTLIDGSGHSRYTMKKHGGRKSKQK